jgi:hypothetical protein
MTGRHPDTDVNYQRLEAEIRGREDPEALCGRRLVSV